MVNVHTVKSYNKFVNKTKRKPLFVWKLRKIQLSANFVCIFEPALHLIMVIIAYFVFYIPGNISFLFL